MPSLAYVWGDIPVWFPRYKYRFNQSPFLFIAFSLSRHKKAIKKPTLESGWVRDPCHKKRRQLKILSRHPPLQASVGILGLAVDPCELLMGSRNPCINFPPRKIPDCSVNTYNRFFACNSQTISDCMITLIQQFTFVKIKIEELLKINF